MMPHLHWSKSNPVWQMVLVLFGLSLAGVFLYLLGAMRNGSWEYWFLLWNLALAWVPLLLSLAIVRLHKTRSWTNRYMIALTLAWLAFLPNTFYMITDYVHMKTWERVDYNFDALMFSMLIFTGVALGIASMMIVHRELNKRLPAVSAWRAMAVVTLLTSFAVYVGRELRWSTWDIVANPAGMLFDVSEIVLRPTAYSQAFTTTFAFFIGIGSLYAASWWAVQLVRSTKR